MKTKLFLGIFLVMLFVLTAGIASAGVNGNGFANRDAGIVPHSSMADAKSTQVFWCPGTLAYISVDDTSAEINRHNTNATISLWTYGHSGFQTPFVLPARVNNKPTSVRYLYLLWEGNRDTTIIRITPATGTTILKEIDANHQGTGDPQVITVDLEAWYPIPYGLCVHWNATNSGSEPNKNYLYGYGAKIRYAGG